MVHIDSLLESLNPEQRDAVRTTEGPLLVLAGAGTGKTKVITTRAAYMIANGTPPDSIVAVSFTNKAAREMRERLAGFVGAQTASRVQLSTFHSFALQLLRHNQKATGLPRAFSIADDNQSRTLLRETLRELRLEEVLPVDVAAEKISGLKDNLADLDSIGKEGGVFDKNVLRAVFDGYNKRLRLYDLIDFDDIVYLAVKMFENNPDLLARLQTRFRFLMIDEFQDTNNAQFEFIRHLGESHRNVCVVGDDDQSIYSWRGARSDVLFHFIKTFPGCKRVSLEQNYRCSPSILNAANAVISQNSKRLEKTLWSEQPDAAPVEVHNAEHERDEAEYVVDTIRCLRAREPNLPWHHIAILVRASQQIAAIEGAFTEAHIPYRVHGGTEFAERREVRDLLAYLRFAHNPRDLPALFRMINLPSRGIGTSTLEAIRAGVEARGTQAPNATEATLAEIANKHKGVAQFVTLWNPIVQRLRGATTLNEIADGLRAAFETVGLREDIVRGAPSMSEARRRTEWVERTLGIISRLPIEKPSLASLIDSLHLDSPDRPQKDEEADTHDKVQIMTIHASKGLEFAYVFLIGIEEGNLPHERSIPQGVEEERRLFYVAMTRAKMRLYVSHCSLRSKGCGNRGYAVNRKPSRFLADLDKTPSVRSSRKPAEETVTERTDAAKRLFEMIRQKRAQAAAAEEANEGT